MNIIEKVFITMAKIYETLKADIATIHNDGDVSAEITTKVHEAVDATVAVLTDKQAQLATDLDDTQEAIITIVEKLKNGDTAAATEAANAAAASIASAVSTSTGIGVTAIPANENEAATTAGATDEAEKGAEEAKPDTAA